ncbi:hypothetical protein [Roseisalinus antarcticus]|uniref:hypothetical protein n=1 Tax=Roseisalinus antarcticus TaxID=254357 RepID=UPI00117B0664|nr:hypothetical protein [Roseisalinus antarcticus]
MTTPSGDIRFDWSETTDGPVTRVFVGETEIAFDPPPAIAWLEARAGTLALIGISQGGNGCSASFVWLHTAPGDLRRTAPFGTCSELVTLSHDVETVTVTMPSRRVADGEVAFVYDGRSIETRTLGLPPAEVGPEAGADALAGVYLFDLTGTEDWRLPLTALMGAANYATLQRLSGQGSPMEVEDDWVVGEGCAPGNCGATASVIAVHRGDGRLLAGFWESGQPPRIWGEPGPTPPRAIAALRERGAQ